MKNPGLYDVVIMLNTDIDAAVDRVEEEYDPDLHDLEATEITGPFKAGFVLSSWND